MQLHEQIIKAVQKAKDRINSIRHGELKIIIQDGKAIRREYVDKDSIKEEEKR